jgi:hypothetical protein
MISFILRGNDLTYHDAESLLCLCLIRRWILLIIVDGVTDAERICVV